MSSVTLNNDLVTVKTISTNNIKAFITSTLPPKEVKEVASPEIKESIDTNKPSPSPVKKPSKPIKESSKESLKDPKESPNPNQDISLTHPYSDVLAKRLRNYRKKLTKIEKYEQTKDPLNYDQLQAIEKKGEVLLVIKELEEMAKQFVTFEKQETQTTKKLEHERKMELEKKISEAVEEEKLKSDIVMKKVSKLIYVLNKVLPTNVEALSKSDFDELSSIKESFFGLPKTPVASYETAIENLCSDLINLSLGKSKENIDELMENLLKFKPVVKSENQQLPVKPNEIEKSPSKPPSNEKKKRFEKKTGEFKKKSNEKLSKSDSNDLIVKKETKDAEANVNFHAHPINTPPHIAMPIPPPHFNPYPIGIPVGPHPNGITFLPSTQPPAVIVPEQFSNVMEKQKTSEEPNWADDHEEMDAVVEKSTSKADDHINLNSNAVEEIINTNTQSQTQLDEKPKRFNHKYHKYNNNTNNNQPGFKQRNTSSEQPRNFKGERGAYRGARGNFRGRKPGPPSERKNPENFSKKPE